MALLFLFFAILFDASAARKKPNGDEQTELFNNNGIISTRGGGTNSDSVSKAGIYPLSWNQIVNGLTVGEMSEKIAQRNHLWESQVEQWANEWRGTKESVSQQDKKGDSLKGMYFNKLYETMKMDRLVLLGTRIVDASINKFFTDSTDVIEILVTTTNQEKDRAGISETIFCKKLAQEKEVSGIFEKILIPLCVKRRDEQFILPSPQGHQAHMTYEEEKGIIERLNKFVKKPKDIKNLTEDDILVHALVTFSYPKLRHIFTKYNKTYGQKIEDVVADSEFNNPLPTLKAALTLNFNVEAHFWQTLSAIIVDVQCGRPHFFALLLKEKLDKLRNNDKIGEADALKDVMRILVTRAPIDLADIDDEFSALSDPTKYTLEDCLDNIIKEERNRKRTKQNRSLLRTISRQKKSENDDDDDYGDIGTTSGGSSSFRSTEAATKEKPSQKIETLLAFKQIVQWAVEQRDVELNQKIQQQQQKQKQQMRNIRP